MLYPKVGLTVAGHRAFLRSDLTGPLQGRVNHVALALEIWSRPRQRGHQTDTPLWRSVFDEAEESSAEKIVISYENFGHGPLGYNFPLLSEKLDELLVSQVIYLRSIERWVRSLHGHRIIGKQRKADSLGEFIEQLGKRLSHVATLDDMASVYRSFELNVGVFEVASHSGLVTDFLNRAEIHSKELGEHAQVADKDRRNRSYPSWAVAFLLWCNRMKLPDRQFLEVRRNLMARAYPNLQEALGQLDLATPADREALRLAARADAPRLADKYGIVFEEVTTNDRPTRPPRSSDLRLVLETVGPNLTDGTMDWFARRSRDDWNSADHLSY